MNKKLTESEKELIIKSEKKFGNLAESLTELVYRADPDTYAANYINRAIEHIYGYTVEEWLANAELWEKSIHSDDKERVFAIIEEARKREEPVIIEYRIIKKDASVKWVKDHISLEKDNEGKIISVNGICYDVTEIKKTAGELKKEKIFTETAIDAQTDTFFIFDPATGQAVRWNKQFSKISGYSDEEISSMKAPESYYSPEDLEKAKAAINDVVTRGKGKAEISLSLGIIHGSSEEPLNIEELIVKADKLMYEHKSNKHGSE